MLPALSFFHPLIFLFLNIKQNDIIKLNNYYKNKLLFIIIYLLQVFKNIYYLLIIILFLISA